MTVRCSLSSFVSRASVVHNGRYDYSETEYLTTHTPTIIICPDHGRFTQRPNRHLQGDGCPTCGYARTRSCIIKPISDIICESKAIHGDKFDYSALLEEGYNGSGIVSIICKTHGKFHQRLSDHLHHGAGCPGCANLIKGQYKLLSQEEFLKRAFIKFGNQFDYSKVKYVCSTTKVIVACSLHGDFEVTPSNHVHVSSGCPKCYSSKGENHIRRILLSANVVFEEQKTFGTLSSGTCKTNRSLLRFDFFLPTRHLLIEYDGYFHYNLLPERRCLSYVDAWDQYLSAKQRDVVKNQFCIDNKINLLRIPYFCKNIEGKLFETIKGNDMQIGFRTLT